MSWGTSWGDSWGASWGDSSGSQTIIDALLLESESIPYDVQLALDAIYALNSPLSSESILYDYTEISLGSGAIITLGFIDGHHVLELARKTPWAPETDLDTGGEIHVGIENDTTVLDSQTVLFSPDIEMGQLLELLEMESTQPSIAIYGDAIYSWALGSGTSMKFPQIDATQSSEATMDLLEHTSTINTIHPYAWNRKDLSTLLVQSTVFSSTVDTDCAIMSPIVAMESYIFMCRLIRDGAPDTPPIYD